MLRDIYDSGRAEFVAVYGRRRVGKTYLIQKFLGVDCVFSATGIIDGNKEEQLFAFTASLLKAGYSGHRPGSWLEAFEALKDVLARCKPQQRCVVYIDELPCFDTPRSGFVKALGYFWNTWASLHGNVFLIVCGSATSWMADNIINNHGGLHNRITRSIYLRQFNLAETEAYLKQKKIQWPRQMIVETYMIFGGIPYYLSLLSHKQSLAQNIDRLYFSRKSELSQEYHRLYASLFRSPEQYIRIVELLGAHKPGLTRNEIARHLRMPSSGTLTQQLDNLEYCDIIRRYPTKRNGKAKTYDAYYQLTDIFTLFHLTFSKKLTTNDYWQQHLNTPTLNTWRGLAFERVCMVHINQVRHALGLDRIAVEYYSWRSTSLPRVQIDMIIERADRLINLCEIKFSQSEFTITAHDDEQMRQQAAAFINETRTKCGVIPTWITPFGLAQNAYAATVTHQVTMDDLFSFL